MHKITDFFSSQKTKLVEACRERAPGLTARVESAAGKAKKVLGSILGKKLVNDVAKPMAAEYAGTTAGSLVPQIPIAISVAETVADRFAPDRDIEANDAADDGSIDRDAQVVSSSRSRKWKVVFIVTGLAVAGGITWVLSKMTGSSQDHPEQDMFMGTMLLSTAGSILGGMQALRASGHQVPENYKQRSVQYFAAAGTVNALRQIMPTATRLAFIPRMIGATTAVVAGTAGYHAQTIAHHYQHHHERMGHSHHKLINMGITVVWGGVPQFAREMASNVSLIPIMDQIAQRSIAAGIEWAVESRAVSNVLARSFNDYARMIQQNPEVQQALVEFRQSYGDEETRADSRETLVRAIETALGSQFSILETAQRRLGPVIQSQISGLVDYIVDEIPNWEENLIGFPLTDRDNLVDNELRKIHLLLCITYAAQKYPSPSMRADLSRSELRTFYGNATKMLCGAYDNVIPQRLQRATIEVIDNVVLPNVVTDKESNILSTFWKRLVGLVQRSTASVWARITSIFRCFSCKIPQDDDRVEVSSPVASYVPQRRRMLPALMSAAMVSV